MDDEMTTMTIKKITADHCDALIEMLKFPRILSLIKSNNFQMYIYTWYVNHDHDYNSLSKNLPFDLLIFICFA